MNEKLDKILNIVQEEKMKQKKDESIGKVPTVESLILNKIKYCRSMKDITDSGFSYDEENGNISCSVCEDKSACGEFSYSAKEGLEFDDEHYLPREFLNLKKSVVRHIKVYKSHKDALKEQE